VIGNQPRALHRRLTMMPRRQLPTTKLEPLIGEI